MWRRQSRICCVSLRPCGKRRGGNLQNLFILIFLCYVIKKKKKRCCKWFSSGICTQAVVMKIRRVLISHMYPACTVRSNGSTADTSSWVKLWHHYFGVRGCGNQSGKVQETKCHKIEQKKKKKKEKERRRNARKEKKRGARWSHCSPHIANSQGGFALSQGSRGEPLAWELKTEAPKLHHNTMETMGSVKTAFFTGLNLLCAVRLQQVQIFKGKPRHQRSHEPRLVCFPC